MGVLGILLQRYFFFFSSRRRHTRFLPVSWARRCVQETATVAIVAASGGAKIAKHGNRAVSSKSGSADVLSELKINTDYSANESTDIILNKGMAFLFAPKYNPCLLYTSDAADEEDSVE
eukprot:TRINITY_DN14575_c0_g1_i2.p4 TRINITY_DN14575_c0_g1~~TRINITY_DN14575_c0_g1_i2.p4  ORF type:complete len:119 (+),score=28.96 TRINITY_DN14575_c0_g1_i2:3-359(+)